jgi:hypothetical protein
MEMSLGDGYYVAADVDAHLKEVEDAHKNQLSCMTDTQAYMEDRAHMEQENENLRFELSALKEQHEKELREMASFIIGAMNYGRIWNPDEALTAFLKSKEKP